jgi:uncharacterized protein with HEPN domain
MCREIEILRDCLDEMIEALVRITHRFEGIESADDFISTDAGRLRLDAISMMLLWLGESANRALKISQVKSLAGYDERDWKGAVGMRHILAHAYGKVDPETVFLVCRDRIPTMLKSLQLMRQMIPDKENG